MFSERFYLAMQWCHLFLYIQLTLDISNSQVGEEIVRVIESMVLKTEKPLKVQTGINSRIKLMPYCVIIISMLSPSATSRKET